MVTKVQKWGNSQGLRLPRHVLEETNIAVGDDVEITVRDGTIIVTPVKPPRRNYDLKELVSRLPPDYGPEEVDSGPPVGREVW